jgi:hypothetical protein
MLLAQGHHLVAVTSQLLPRISTRPSPPMPHAPLPDSRPNNDADSPIPMSARVDITERNDADARQLELLRQSQHRFPPVSRSKWEVSLS